MLPTPRYEREPEPEALRPCSGCRREAEPGRRFAERGQEYCQARRSSLAHLRVTYILLLHYIVYYNYFTLYYIIMKARSCV